MKSARQQQKKKKRLNNSSKHKKQEFLEIGRRNLRKKLLKENEANRRINKKHFHFINEINEKPSEAYQKDIFTKKKYRTQHNTTTTATTEVEERRTEKPTT